MLFFNEDWMHFITTRYHAGIELTENVIRDYVYAFRGTQVTDFTMNVNGTLSTAPSDLWDTFADKYAKTEENGKPVDYRETFVAAAHALQQQGLDLYAIWTETAREIGIRPWISVRMNDCHGSHTTTDIRQGEYIGAHPEQYIGAYREKTGYFDYCLNFEFAQVRQRLVDYIDEMLGRYDVYGLELDMMRDFAFFPFYRVDAGYPFMKQFMEAVFAIVAKHEQSRGHDIKIALIAPSSPNMLLERGGNLMDFIDGIDYITIISRWQTTNTDMPIELWKQLLRGTKVKLGGGQQLLYKPYSNYKEVIVSEEMSYGQAVANLSRGCEYVYLYNYMDMCQFWGSMEGVEKYFYPGSIRSEGALPRIFRNIGAMDTLLKQTRSHVVTFDDFFNYAGNYARLPITFGCSDAYERIKLPVGTLPDNAKLSLLLGIGQEDPLAPEDIQLYVNGKRAEFTEQTKINPNIYEGDCFAFRAEPAQLNVMYAEVRIDKKCAIEYVELRVTPV